MTTPRRPRRARPRRRRRRRPLEVSRSYVARVGAAEGSHAPVRLVEVPGRRPRRGRRPHPPGLRGRRAGGRGAPGVRPAPRHLPREGRPPPTSLETMAAASPPPWSSARLHVVTGKGGIGKTTVASALALALSRKGKRVLLCEVEGRQGISQTFDVPPLGHRRDARRRTTASGGEVWALSVDAKAALLRVPADLLQARPRRRGAGAVRRHRLRDDDRPRACATCCSSARSTRRPPRRTAGAATAPGAMA